MEPQQDRQDGAAKFEAVQGAMDRAAKLPEVACKDTAEGQMTWDHGDVWLGDWGKWEDYGN